MLDLIPLEYYEAVYYNIVLMFVLLTIFHAHLGSVSPTHMRNFNNIIGFVFFVFLVVFIGLRPLNILFSDMIAYARRFDTYALGGTVETDKDAGFNYFTKFFSGITNKEGFFTICALLYVGPLYMACKRFFNVYFFLGFLMCVCSLSFWSYATNGVRNGIATSLIVLAIASDKNRAFKIFLFMVAVAFHKSSLLPMCAYIAASYYYNTKTYLYIWGGSILLSLTMGNFWITFFTNIGFDDDRLNAYLTSTDDLAYKFSSTGFRWDFVVYSLLGIASGWYFIYRKKFNDPLYLKLYHTYVLSNALWVLVINASFSNRFAYLSWFLMAFVIIYPLLKARMWQKQYVKVSFIILAYFSFTYIMTLLKK